MHLTIRNATAALKRPVGVASTSCAALEGMMTRNELSDRRRDVLDAIIDLGKATNEDIAEHLSWKLNRVTGRTTELHKMGFVEVAGIGRSRAGNSSKLWRSSDPNDLKLRQIE